VSVSYVVTVYNKAPYLPLVLAAIDAEWRDTGGEIVVVDDGSTDDSVALLRAYANARSHVVLHEQANAGVAAATNTAIGLARQPLLRLVDADDLLIAGSTARLMRALEETGAGFAYGRFGNYLPGTPLPPPPIPSDEPAQLVGDGVWRMLTSQPFVPSATLAVRNRVAAAFPLPEGPRTSQDFAMGLRIGRLTPFAAIADIVCLLPSDAPGRLSGSKARMYSDTALLVAMQWEAGDVWSAKHRRYAVQRAAGRARHYARRHLSYPKGRMAWLLAVSLVSRLPILSFGPETLRKIAAVYAEALVDPTRYP
jgi:hypothetical protein